jgi:hypothetical protein
MFLSDVPFKGTAIGISSLVSLSVFNTASQKQAKLASGSTLTIEEWKAEQTATVGKRTNLSSRGLLSGELSRSGDSHEVESANKPSA